MYQNGTSLQGNNVHCKCLMSRTVLQIVRISETKEGHLDLVDLENQLQFQHALEGSDRTLIGCFSAASNITGLLADDVATTLLLHQYGALAFWDYATAGTVCVLCT